MAADESDRAPHLSPSTASAEYTNRLQTKSASTWKQVLNVQAPYQWKIRRLCPGKTLEIGCGIGRNLKSLAPGSVGVDHNFNSIQVARALGLNAQLPDEFFESHEHSTFDVLLVAHVLEHLSYEESRALLTLYLPYLKPNGRVVVICPQERGYASDPTHVTWLDQSMLSQILNSVGVQTIKQTSFPLPRVAGRYFTYNESVVLGIRSSLST